MPQKQITIMHNIQLPKCNSHRPDLTDQYYPPIHVP
jgi:hypothetical protein